MSKKKIIFDSIAIGLGVLFLALLAIPVAGDVSCYTFISAISELTPSGEVQPFEVIMFLTALFMLFLLLFIIIITSFMIVVLLCDLNVIKNEKLVKAFRKTSLVLASINIAFTVLLLPLLGLLYEKLANYFSIVVLILLAIACVVIISISRDKKNKSETTDDKKEVSKLNDKQEESQVEINKENTESEVPVEETQVSQETNADEQVD